MAKTMIPAKGKEISPLKVAFPQEKFLSKSPRKFIPHAGKLLYFSLKQILFSLLSLPARKEDERGVELQGKKRGVPRRVSSNS
ncbi:Hypothetical protein Minf_1607 [Methylacidiphilum infernorum V4]|uniref:Uncharacterized protein n=1 Tax=Methylacidiphilum infernorum (isolate V4) TaxID=481448 RepID=B3DWF8_METI4|nr:Hypothetical protein Minf_1607 [Methylacidiphilum infernorum V4]